MVFTLLEMPERILNTALAKYILPYNQEPFTAFSDNVTFHKCIHADR